MKKRPERSLQEKRDDARHFAATRAVLESSASPRLDAGALKLLRILLTVGSDSVISSDGFLTRLAGSPKREFSYLLALAPAALGNLLTWAEVKEWRDVRAAIVPLRELKLPPDRSHERCLIWLRDEGNTIRLAARPESDELMTVLWPAAIEAAAHSPSAKVYRELDPARPCPHCAVPLARVRELKIDRAMMCEHCGRTFRAWDPAAPNRREA